MPAGGRQHATWSRSATRGRNFLNALLTHARTWPCRAARTALPRPASRTCRRRQATRRRRSARAAESCCLHRRAASRRQTRPRPPRRPLEVSAQSTQAVTLSRSSRRRQHQQHRQAPRAAQGECPRPPVHVESRRSAARARAAAQASKLSTHRPRAPWRARVRGIKTSPSEQAGKVVHNSYRGDACKELQPACPTCTYSHLVHLN